MSHGRVRVEGARWHVHDRMYGRLCGDWVGCVVTDDLVNLALGVIGSLIGWVLLAKVWRPRLVLGKSLQLIASGGESIYRVYYKNPLLRRVEDVQVSVRVSVKPNIGPSGGLRRWFSIQIPVDEPYKPVLGRRTTFRRFLSMVRRKPRLIQYCVLLLDEVDDTNFGRYLRPDTPPIEDLTAFLRATDATLELAVRCADGFSGTYRTQAKTYKQARAS